MFNLIKLEMLNYMLEYNSIKNEEYSLDFQIIASKLKKEIIDHPYRAFVKFLFFTIVIVAIATFLSYASLLPFVYNPNQNSTSLNVTYFINQNSSNFVSIFVNTMLTLGLILFSALSLSSAQDALKQSEKQQKQLRDEQRIREIEKRLEFFYMPAQSIMKITNEYIKDPYNIINSTKIDNYEKRGYESNNMPPEERACIYAVKKLEEIEQHRYLAKEKTCRAFTKFVYEEESNENRLELLEYIQTDIKSYLVEFNTLKVNNNHFHKDEQIEN